MKMHWVEYHRIHGITGYTRKYNNLNNYKLGEVIYHYGPFYEVLEEVKK